MNFLRKIGFLSAFLIPALVILGLYLGTYWNGLSLLFVFVLIPVIDRIMGLDTHNIPSSEKARVGEEYYYRFVTYCWTYFQFAFLVWACYEVSIGKLKEPFEWVAFTIGCGLVTGGIGITVAHELGHKKSKLEQFYSQALLMTVCYMHFFIEHNRGHHVYVATPLDPATARKKQPFYSFWFQSVVHGYLHAWQLETESLQRRGKSILSLNNTMIWYAVLPVIFCALLTGWFSQGHEGISWQAPLFFVGQSVVAFTLLELVNYVEHYGISRKQIAPDHYERVNPMHSWNASHLISNFFLFQLQRHSDHHYNAIKRYQLLDHYDESPQLPFGYPTMILAALVPPVWFGMMDGRLAEWEKRASPTPLAP